MPAPLQADQTTPIPVNPKALRGDLAIRGLFERGTTAIIDVRVVDLDSPSHRNRDPMSVLVSAEKEKKKKYLEACQSRRCSFTPFVVSVDGLLAPEAQSVLTRLATQLSEKWQQSYGPIKAVVTRQISVALARTCHHCLRSGRSRPPPVHTYRAPDTTDPDPTFRESLF